MPRPNVFPTGDNQPQENKQPPVQDEKSIDAAYKPQTDDAYQKEVTNVMASIYGGAIYGEQAAENNIQSEATRQMLERTQRQLAERNAQLSTYGKQVKAFEDQFIAPQEKSTERPFVHQQPQMQQQKPVQTAPQPQQKPVTKAEIKQPVKNVGTFKAPQVKTDREEQVERLSQPQFDSSFDVLPLPSAGKIYKIKKPSVKVSFINTLDENILSSGNLLQSGEWLEILINRKLLEKDLRYKDLHVGDRNAIMIWLRATAYGNMYPVTMLDENNVPFDTEIDLATLKTKPLGDTPDENGEFDFFCPMSKSTLKFKLLTVAQVEELEKMLIDEQEAGIIVNNEKTYKLQMHIVEVDGNRDEDYIYDFIDKMRPMDSNGLIEHIDNIESGVDLEVEIQTPGGGSIKAFFPLNPKFFWPKLRI
jgi:hypothetical protein